MAEPALVAVAVTEERFRALKHNPSGLGFEADGTARWPADQFTFRLRDEGAIRLLECLNDVGLPEGVIPGVTPGYPVDAISGRLLDLDEATRTRLAETPIGASGEAGSVVGRATTAAKAASAPASKE